MWLGSRVSIEIGLDVKIMGRSIGLQALILSETAQNPYGAYPAAMIIRRRSSKTITP
jgi:hypothetical protein